MGIKPARDLSVHHGHDVERWMLKILLGTMYAEPNPPVEVMLPRQTEIRKVWLRALFGEHPLRPPMGLYVRSSAIVASAAMNGVEHSPLLRWTLAGLNLSLFGIDFLLY